MPDIIVTAIMQDSRGFVWLGSRTGLYRFDGYNYHLYEFDANDTNSISSNMIYQIWEDESGNLWITTLSGLNRFNRIKETFTRFQHKQLIEKKMEHAQKIVGMIPVRTGTILLSTWLGELLEFDMKTERFKKIKPTRGDKEFNFKTPVIEIKTDVKGRIWVGTLDDGLYVFDPNNNYNLIHHYQHIDNDPSTINSNIVFSVLPDNKGNIWIGTSQGMNIIIPGNNKGKQGTINHINPRLPEMRDFMKYEIYGIKEDREGNLWIRSSHGIITYQPETGNSKIWPVETSKLNSIDKLFSLKTLMLDNTGSVWYSSIDHGISRLNFQLNSFDFIGHDSTDINSLNNDKVTSIYQDTSGILWIGTRSMGLNKRIPAMGKNKTETWDHYTHNPLDPNSISNNEIRSIIRDSRGDLWIGTHSGGINKLVDQEKGPVQFESYRPDFVEETERNQLDEICEDNEGNLWIGGSNLYLFDRDKKRFYRYVADLNDTDSLSVIAWVNEMVAYKSSVWMSTWSGGLVKISPPYRKSGNFITGTTRIYNNINLQGNLGDWGTRTICVPKIHTENVIWIGTNGRGLLCLRKDHKKSGTMEEYFVVYNKKDGLTNLVVQGIEEDNDGNIWISTKSGLSRFDPVTGLFTNYYEEDGLADDFFKVAAHYKSPDGKLYFGVDGLISFYPEEIFTDDYIPPVYLCGISISNVPLKIGDNSPLKKTLSETKEITLSHDQNFISLEFAALNYTIRNETRYKYKLEGFESEWIDAGTDRNASYQGLQPGSYTFRVIASNRSGTWNTQGATLKITIRPPWWRTIAATITYIILLILAVFGIIKVREKKLVRDKKILEEKVFERTEELHEVNTQLEEHKEELEQQKEELQQTLDYLKDTQAQLVQSEKLASIGQLTAGIAHEINNPVNYINAGIESLEVNLNEIREILDLYNEITPKNVEEKLTQIMEVKQRLDYRELILEIRKLIGSIKAGSERTTEIVRGLRTFSRLDENEIKPTDLHEGIDITLVMLHNKFKHHVKISKEYGELPMVECFPGKLNQVFMNILSNAIEAIAEKGTITIKTWEDKPKGRIVVSIKDDGMGMTKDVMSNIFNPFFTTKEVGKGTGLGLSVSHGIIEQHKGDIKVESSPGKGTEFIISLPIKHVE